MVFQLAKQNGSISEEQVLQLAKDFNIEKKD